MGTISVKAAPGRLVPRSLGGKPVPTGRFIPVVETQWIRDRIAAGDLVVEPKAEPAPAPQAEEDLGSWSGGRFTNRRKGGRGDAPEAVNEADH